jgi:hypothetical protein
MHGNYKVDHPWFCPKFVVLQRESGVREGGAVELHHGKGGRVGEVTPLQPSSSPKTAQVSEVPNHVRSTNGSQVPEAQERPHKRSRYTTLPEPIDEALGLLNRELEQANEMKGLLKQIAARNHALEQEMKIMKAQEVLSAKAKRDWSPGVQVLELTKEVEGLRRENAMLKKVLERLTEKESSKEDERFT